MEINEDILPISVFEFLSSDSERKLSNSGFSPKLKRNVFSEASGIKVSIFVRESTSESLEFFCASQKDRCAPMRWLFFSRKRL